MSVAPVEPTTPAAPTEPPAAAATPPVPAPPTDPPKATEPPASPWSDPAAAAAEIKRLRAENAKDRTNSKAQAAEDARKELAESIGKVLNPDAPAQDPAKLVESLTTAQSAAKQARVELAVFRHAAAAGGDPSALLDSSSFLASLAAVDPTDSAAVTAAIQSAVEANSRLGAAPAGPTPPAPNPAQGAGANGSATVTQLTREQLAGMSPEAIEKARLEGRLDVALGIAT